MGRVVVHDENLKVLDWPEKVACLLDCGLFSYFEAHCEVKCAAFSAFAIHPNASSQHLHDAMGNR